MKCPICVQEVQPSDHPELWGPEFAHSRCIIAFNAGSAVQDAKLQVRIKRLEDAMSEIAYAASHPLGAGQSLTLGKIESIAIKAKEDKP